MARTKTVQRIRVIDAQPHQWYSDAMGFTFHVTECPLFPHHYINQFNPFFDPAQHPGKVDMVWALLKSDCIIIR